MTAKKMKVESGGARMKRTGKKPIMIGATQEQYDTIEAAALISMRPKAQFVLHYAMEAAKEILKNHKNSQKQA